MNYDELERKWHLKYYQEATSLIPEGANTVAALLSSCVHQVCEDLREEKEEMISTLDDELSNIFSSGFSDLFTAEKTESAKS